MLTAFQAVLDSIIWRIAIGALVWFTVAILVGTFVGAFIRVGRGDAEPPLQQHPAKCVLCKLENAGRART